MAHSRFSVSKLLEEQLECDCYSLGDNSGYGYGSIAYSTDVKPEQEIYFLEDELPPDNENLLLDEDDCNEDAEKNKTQDELPSNVSLSLDPEEYDYREFKEFMIEPELQNSPEAQEKINIRKSHGLYEIDIDDADFDNVGNQPVENDEDLIEQEIGLVESLFLKIN